MTNSQILSSLLLFGLLGLIGQGVRAIVGLGGGVNASSSAANQQSAFNAAYLLFTLMIGFIAGVLAGLAAFDQIATALTFKMALGVMAAGYAGADFIENTFTGLLGSLGVGRAPVPPGPQPAGPQPAAPQPTAPTAGPQPAGPQPAAPTAGPQPAESQPAGPQPAAPPPGPQPAPAAQPMAPRATEPAAGAGDAMAERLTDAESRLTRLEAIAAPVPADLIPNADDAITRVTVDMVYQMFPATRRAPVARNLPFVLAGLQGADLTDKAMVCMALGTIRAETEGFVPIPEGVSRYNTERTPFDLYEPGTAAGRRVGNTQPGDGARYKGRGFVQLTGRSNYTNVGKEIHVDLAGSPELADDPALAGKILAQFLFNSELDIRAALARNDLAAARRLVNGGSHDLDKFTDAYQIGLRVIPT